MTKQEEIKEVLNTLCAVAKVKDLTKSPTGFDDEVYSAMLELQELGVVIEVERELPEFKLPLHIGEQTGVGIVAKEWHKHTQEYMLKAGYIAVEPLIRDDK